jgi:hypothetical protein
MDILEKFLNHYSYKFEKGYPDLNNENDVILIEQLLSSLTGNLIELDEVKLSPSQLDKPYYQSSEFYGKYSDRGERFLDKILTGEPFILDDGTEVIIDKNKSEKAIDLLKNKNYKDLGGVNKLFYDSEGNTYSLSSFKKTQEFGSSRGKGGGSENTRVQESSQCVVNAIAFNIIKSSISPTDINEENLTKGFSFCSIDASLDEVKQFILGNKTWIDTFILTANALYNSYSGPNFNHHRKSEFIDLIYKNFKFLSKQEGLTLKPDKWNPSDIWLVDSSLKSIDNPSSLAELNTILLKLYSEDKLIGVSLKKLGKSAKITINNIEDSIKKEYKYEGYECKPTNGNSRIIYGGGNIVFRTFNYATNFAGEILGKTAAHGKIGHSNINYILKLNGMPVLPSSLEVKTLLKEKNSKFIDEYYEIYSKIVEDLPKEKFITDVIESKDLNFLVSKFLSANIIYILLNAGNKKDDIVTELVSYSSSSGELSSVYIKVE